MLEFDATTHTYRRHGKTVPSVTQVLEHAGIIDKQWFTEECRERGTAVHLACEYADKGILDRSSLHPEVAPRLEAWERFKEDQGIEILAIEEKIYSDVYHYAGTYDRLVMSRAIRFPTIIEIKSGPMPPWAGLQTAGYERAIDIAKWTGHELRRRPPLVRFGIELREDATYRLTRFDSIHDWTTFLGAVSIYNWKRRVNAL